MLLPVFLPPANSVFSRHTALADITVVIAGGSREHTASSVGILQ
jgi:hypothetical protein